MKTKTQSVKSNFTVVGIGASAGGLEPLQHIVARLPSQLPHVAIVIAQHLSADYKSMLVELMGRRTKLEVKHIDDEMSVEPNTIYIAPASHDVIVEKGKFKYVQPADIGAHPSIDILFNSLAKEYKRNCCGIILSGTGKDGSKGIAAIKKQGGSVVVQNPNAVRYEGMPQSAIDTGLVDYVLSQDEIGEQFTTIINSRRQPRAASQSEVANENNATEQILDLLEKRIGIDFSDYKMSTITRRLAKRIHEKKFENEASYLRYIRSHPEELDDLFESMLIGVTAFFRDAEAFKQIQRVVKNIVMDKKDGEIIRVWIPGCATGEEAYTYGILFLESIERLKRHITVQIFATDIDLPALQKSRLGVYSAQSLKGMDDNLIAKYFVRKSDNNFEVNRDLHNIVLFSRHDVTSNPPFLRLDLISCRNLLIYFNLNLQKKVFPLFYYALNSYGHLVLGKSENIGSFQNLFSTVDPRHKIYQRRAIEGKMPRLPQLRQASFTLLSKKNHEKQVQHEQSISELVKETLVANYEHPYVVVDENLDVVEINGDVSMYLNFKAGSASLNIYKLIDPDLQLELRTSLSKTVSLMTLFKGGVRKFGLGDGVKLVRISTRPVLNTQPHNSHYIVQFESIEYDQNFYSVDREISESNHSVQVSQLEQDLDSTKEYLNSLMQEIETSNEELQAMNEELQSSNEELQASNEELESANEELQATNEELENAYSELREANLQNVAQKHELLSSQNNLKALLNNTQVGFILVDTNYRVAAFNIVAQKTFKNIFNSQLEVSEPIISVANDQQAIQFISYLRQAFTGKKITVEQMTIVKNNREFYFDINYTPIERENKSEPTAYVSISFLDITSRKVAEQELLVSNEYNSSIIASSPDCLKVLDLEGNILSMNENGKVIMEIDDFDQFIGRKWTELWHVEFHDEIKKALTKARKGGTGVLQGYAHTAKGKLKWWDVRVSPIKDSDGKVYRLLAVSRDITRLKDLERQREEFIAIATHELKTPVTSVKAYTQVLHAMFTKNNDMASAQLLAKMDLQLNKLIGLIGDLLDVTKIETGKLQFHESNFELNGVITEIIEELQRTTTKHQIIFRPQDAHIIYGDADRIGQVLNNLINNAIKYSPEDGIIEVRAENDKRMVKVSVTDNGIGLSKKDQDKIFDRFYRVVDKEANSLPGLGLGLYISAEIIKRHNGQVGVTSNGKGKGSTFYFTIPAIN